MPANERIQRTAEPPLISIVGRKRKKLMIFRVLLCILVVVGMTSCSTTSSSGKPQDDRIFSLLSGKISVSAMLTESIEDKGVPPFYSFLIIIEDTCHRYEVKPDIILADELGDAVNVLRNGIYTKDGYTFVRHECGGGNGWRCNVESIFSTKYGFLQYIGDMAGAEERGAVGYNYSDGLFMDYYDKFETNRLTSHAEAPFLKIYSRDDNGFLRVDLEVTWQRNLDSYKNGKDARDRILKKSDISEEESRALRSILLEEAVTTKYCAHTKEMEEALRIADRSLSKDILKDFRMIVEEVIPGDLPKSRVKRTR
ncbi:MAG: hypothetical protein ACLQBD_04680 [Syntrophobacteraceae bacterium]